MKRNNYFMIAYILFIGFCIIGRLFVEYESWGRLVAAVTCSSWFFAVADSHLSVVEYMQKHIDITTYAKSNLKSIDTIIQGLHKRIAKMNTEPEDNEKSISDGEQLIKDLEKMKLYFQDKEAEIAQDQKKVKRSSFWSKLFTVAGFFTFFLIMTFNVIARIAEESQDFLTVVAFVSILLTQYLAPLQREQNAKEKEEFEEIIQDFKNLSARYDQKEH